MLITPAMLRTIAAYVIKCAREKAVASLRENSHEDYRRINSQSGSGYTCEFAYYFDSALESIVDSLRSPRECCNYTAYGPLTAKQACAVLTIARRATAGGVQ